MAFIISIDTQYGIEASYWKIVDLNINWLTKNSHVSMCGWIDKASRDAGQQPLDQRSFDWSGDAFPFIETEPQNERELAYDTIKSLEDGEFADAVDG